MFDPSIGLFFSSTGAPAGAEIAAPGITFNYGSSRVTTTAQLLFTDDDVPLEMSPEEAEAARLAEAAEAAEEAEYVRLDKERIAAEAAEAAELAAAHAALNDAEMPKRRASRRRSAELVQENRQSSAASTIAAAFKGMRVRRGLQEQKEAATMISAAFKSMKDDEDDECDEDDLHSDLSDEELVDTDSETEGDDGQEGEVSHWFSVLQVFKADQSAGFWAARQDDNLYDPGAANAGWNKLGFHQHVFMPAGLDGPSYSIWESKEEITEAAFTAFIDGPDGAGEVFDNMVKATVGGVAPPRAFTPGYVPPERKVTGGAAFACIHKFKPGASDGFWKSMAAFDQAANTVKINTLGFHNHSFLPAGIEGPCYCYWETKDDMSLADFQAFVDGPDGPGGSSLVFENKAFKAMNPGATLFPSFFDSGTWT